MTPVELLKLLFWIQKHMSANYTILRYNLYGTVRNIGFRRPTYVQLNLILLLLNAELVMRTSFTVFRVKSVILEIN